VKRRQRRLLRNIVLVLVLVAVVLFWRFPMRSLELLGRATLRGTGFEKHETTAASGRVVYWAKGTGPLVVLVHGVNDQAGAWARVAGPLARAHRVLVVDLPGHGESEPRQGPLRIREVRDGLSAVLEAERGSGPASLVGNSMGGWMSLLVAKDRPADVARVILVNGTALRAAPKVSLLPKTREDARRAMDAVTGPAAPPAAAFVLDDLVRRAPTSPLARILANADFEDGLSLEGKLEGFKVPVTLVWGEADELLPRAYAERVATALGGAPLLLLPGCGHMPQRECPGPLLLLLEQVLGTSLPR